MEEGEVAEVPSGTIHPDWHAWMAAGYRLLEAGGALTRGGELVVEPLLASIASAEELPWPIVDRRPADADMLAFLEPARILDEGRMTARMVTPAGGSNGTSSSGGGASSSGAHVTKRPRIDYRPGCIFWAPSVSVYPLVLTARHPPDRLEMRTMSTTDDPRPTTYVVSKNEVEQFGSGLREQWDLHREDYGFLAAVREALFWGRRGPLRSPKWDPRKTWHTYGPDEPFPFEDGVGS